MAIEDIENKIIKIRTENDNEKKDKVKLEMHLKGVVATVVNAGPLHVAETFLRFILKYPGPCRIFFISCLMLGC